jgi:hypothetical protein
MKHENKTYDGFTLRSTMGSSTSICSTPCRWAITKGMWVLFSITHSYSLQVASLSRVSPIHHPLVKPGIDYARTALNKIMATWVREVFITAENIRQHIQHRFQHVDDFYFNIFSGKRILTIQRHFLLYRPRNKNHKYASLNNDRVLVRVTSWSLRL